MSGIDKLRDLVNRPLPQALLVGLPLFFRTVTARAESLPTTALDHRGFNTELGVSKDQTSAAFARELSVFAASESTGVEIGPGPLARLVKALRLSLKEGGAVFRGAKHAGIHLRSMFNADRGVFMERMLEAANKGTHSVLLISDDAAAKLAEKGVDKLDELSNLLTGSKLDDIPFNRAMQLEGGATVTRSKFWNSAEKLTVNIPAEELGITRAMVSIFDAKAYKKAIDEAIKLGRDPKLIDPNSFCEPAKSVDNLTYVFFGELSTGSKLVNGLLTMYPNAQRLAIGATVLTASTAVKAKAETAMVDASTTVERRVEQLTAEHLAQFAAGMGIGDKIDVTSTWDKVTDAGKEIGFSMAVDWGLVAKFGSRVGGVISLLLMPTEMGKGSVPIHNWPALMRPNVESIADAMTNDILERLTEELDRAGYKDSCAFGDKIRKDVRAGVVENLAVLLAPN